MKWKLQRKKTGESLPIKLVNKMMIVILLFLHLFLFGNMVVDSIVGEKERKTGEILVAMPLSHTDIIIGKNMAIVVTIALQIAIWIIILLIAGFGINNVLLVYMVIVLIAISIVGITSVIAAYSKNYKEAGIGLSFIYIAIVGYLIIPALAYISRQLPGSNILNDSGNAFFSWRKCIDPGTGYSHLINCNIKYYNFLGNN